MPGARRHRNTRKRLLTRHWRLRKRFSEKTMFSLRPEEQVGVGTYGGGWDIWRRVGCRGKVMQADRRAGMKAWTREHRLYRETQLVSCRWSIDHRHRGRGFDGVGSRQVAQLCSPTPALGRALSRWWGKWIRGAWLKARGHEECSALTQVRWSNSMHGGCYSCPNPFCWEFRMWKHKGCVSYTW